MQWILEKCCYNIQDLSGNNNRRPLNADLCLLIVYTAFSLFNAILVWIPQPILNKWGIMSGGTPPTLIIIIINFIVLVRLNISLYIKAKGNMEAELQKLYIQRQVITELSINTWRIRMWIVSVGYFMDLIVGIVCIIYGAQTYSSLSVIVIISIIETFLNNLIDNYEIRYMAVPKVYKRV